ncbi:pectinesterase family protein [Celerinatantimonas yamalensis]|uniref:Pectinesterase n=1 Tax=Celerinatantimonas yamalensis TaxID=559956 RepID=A0ABW9G7A8_9GAMM
MKTNISSALLLSLFCSFAYAENYDAIVSPAFSSQDESAHHYSKITQAIAAAQAAGREHYTIYVKDGVYNEKFEIKVPGVQLIGQDRDKTIIEYNSASGMKRPDGKKWGTSGSYVLRVSADNVTLKNLTVRNSFNYPANDAKPQSDPTKIRSSQAVALEVNKNANHVKVEQVVMDGYQDTVLVKAGSTTYFKDCVVKGNVDFIFGGGTAVFDHCNVIARNRAAGYIPMGYITAPSTDVHTPYGLVFINSRIEKEAGVPKDSYGLGRPWHPTRTFKDGRYADPEAIGATLYVNCYLGDHLFGWDKMSGWTKDHEVQWFYPDKDARFFGYHNYGPGAKNMSDGHKLPDHQGKQITIAHVLGGQWYK